VRPIPIAEVTLPPLSRISPVPGTGWLVTHGAESPVTLLDTGLRAVTHFDVPAIEASARGQHVAAVTRSELTVCDRRGRVLWRREHTVSGVGRPSCHLDAQEILWVYLTGVEELIAYEGTTGRELDRVRLGSSDGAADLFPHPDGRRLGLGIAMGQHTPLSHLAWLADGRIRGRDLPGGLLNGFTSDGDRYLALPHPDLPEIAIRDVSTGAIVVARDPAEFGGSDIGAAALVSDALIIVGIDADHRDFENHVLLSTRRLNRQADVDYGVDMSKYSVRATDGQGRWLTAGWRGGPVRLWELPDRVTGEIPGQLDLW
jgi:hypothetical protein